MGSLFKRTERRPVPRAAEIVTKDGKRFARWKLRGKTVAAEIVTGPDGTETVAVKSGAYIGKFRDHNGRVIERSTGCRDESTARQKLAGWEKEVEQIRAGVLDASALDTARAAAGAIEPHLDAYEQSLAAREVSGMYKANAVRAVRRLVREIPLTTLRDLRREIVEAWFADAISEGLGARNRNHYREAISRFANWCVETGRLRDHDLDRLPKADERADPRRPRRALTADEFARLLTVARTRPLDDARTVRRGKQKGERVADLRPDVADALDELGRERVLIYRTHPDRVAAERAADPDRREHRPHPGPGVDPARRGEREERGGLDAARAGGPRRRTPPVGRREDADPGRPAVHRAEGVAADPRPGSESGRHPEAGRPRPDGGRSRPPDDVRDAPQHDRDGPADRASRAAALGHQADDGRLHRPGVARRAGRPRPPAGVRSDSGEHHFAPN